MVHLGKIATDKDVSDRLNPAIDELSLGAPGADEFTSSVYGSRFAATDLPKHEMQEEEMPREIAYRMIKDDLTLDGTPTLKYVSKSSMAVLLPPANDSIASPHLLQPTWKMKPRS